MNSFNMESKHKIIKVNRLLIGRYRIAQPQETNNSYHMDNRDVPSTYTNLTEPEISNICNLGENVLSHVIGAHKNVNNANLRKIEGRDIIKHLNFNNCKEDPTYISLGTDGIHTNDLNVSEENYEPIILEGKGIPVDNFLLSNPCKNCLNEGRNYFCSYKDQCTADLFKIKIDKKIVHSIDRNHKMSCFKIASTRTNSLLVDCQTNQIFHHKTHLVSDRESNHSKDSPPRRLKDNEFYIINKNKIILPYHGDQSKQKLVDGIVNTIKKENIKDLFIYCNCIINNQIINHWESENLISYKLNIYFLNEDKHCQHYCSFKNQKQINTLIAQDQVVESCEILTSDKRLIDQYNEIINKNDALFSKDAFDIGCHSDPITNEPYIYHYRLKPGAIPFVARFIPISQKKEKAATEIIKQLINNKIIERNVSNWVSCAVWVPKTRAALTQKQAEERNIKYVPLTEDTQAHQSLRLAINFKPLNSQLEMPIFPLPSVKTLLARLRPNIVLTIADLTQSYFSLKISKESSLLTGFFSGIPHDGVLTFLRAAQGVNCSSTFLLAAMHNILFEVRDHVIHYSDNLIIFSSPADHPSLVEKVFKLLRESKMKIKKSKTLLNCTQPVKLLGMIYCPKTHRLFPDKTKVEGLTSMKIPANITELKSFLGGVQYLLQCLNDIQDDIAILYKATRKSPKFEFGPQQIIAFNNVI